MTTTKTFSFLSMIAVAFASPISFSSLEVRDGNVCYPENMPIGVSDYNCPKKNTLDSKGECTAAIPNVPGDQGCSAYCEVRLTPIYGQEVPFKDGTCQAETLCGVAQAQSVTVTNTYTVNLNAGLSSGDDITKILTAAFDIGASYSYSESVGYSTTETFSKTLGVNECGYWTFIPFMFSSCGTLTTAAQGETPAGQYDQDESPYCEKNSLSNTPNYCNTTPYKDSTGHADGKVVFVYTNCATNAVLKTGQDPAYWYPGVSTGPKEG